MILALSLLLTACGAEAKQPDKPGPAPQVDQIFPTEPEPLTNMEVEKPEISQEALEAIFETVYLSAVDSHPEDWNVEFQITDEVGKITAALPEDVKAPSDLRAIYTEWREAQTEQDTPELPVREAEEPATSEPPAEPVARQPTTSNNKGNSSGGSSTTSQSQESSSTSGSSDDWRKNMRTDVEGYIDAGEGEYLDPNAQRGSIGGSAPSATDTDSTTTPAPSTNTDTGSSGGSSSDTSDTSGYTTQYGYTVPLGHHVELCADGKTYKLVNDETGRYEIISGVDMTGYVAGTGQLESDTAGYDTGIRFES